MKKYASYQEYIKDQTGRGKEMMETLKRIILESVPSAYETMGYGVPAYGLKENAKLKEKIMIANYKKHVGFYPHPDTIDAFREELSEYKVLEGTIQIKHTQEIDEELFKRMVVFRYNTLHNTD